MLNIYKKELIFLLIVFFGFTACAKKPETPLSPSVKINIEKKGEEKTYAAYFTCGLKNENDSTAFINVEGLIEIKDKNNTPVLSVPFKIPVILPFETGIVQERIELKADQITPVFNLLSISAEKLDSGEELGNRFIEEKNIAIKKLMLEKKDIIELLRGKLNNEKNK
jgi:hypothetical protein